MDASKIALDDELLDGFKKMELFGHELLAEWEKMELALSSLSILDLVPTNMEDFEWEEVELPLRSLSIPDLEPTNMEDFEISAGNSTLGKDKIDQVVDRSMTIKLDERCNELGGCLISHSFGGGAGSEIKSLMMETNFSRSSGDMCRRELDEDRQATTNHTRLIGKIGSIFFARRPTFLSKTGREYAYLPEARARADDQGNLGVCTSFSEAKATVQGFDDGIFYPHQRLNFSQSDVRTVMVNTDRRNVAKSPGFFDGKTYLLQEKDSKIWYNVEIAVAKIRASQFEAELRTCFQTAKYVAVYDPDILECRTVRQQKWKKCTDRIRKLLGMKIIAHAIFVYDYVPETTTAKCMNSWGATKSNIDIQVKDILELYRVNCSAERA